MTKIQLAGCGIKGQFGDMLTLPTLLSANFANNKLYGSLTPGLFNAKAFQSLTVYNNILSVSLAVVSKFISLILLDAHNNNFSGALSVLQTTMGYLSVATSSGQVQWT